MPRTLPYDPSFEVFNWTRESEDPQGAAEPFQHFQVAEQFQYFHRMVGFLLPDRHLAVDFDLNNTAWRILDLEYPDPVREFSLAKLSNSQREMEELEFGTPRRAKSDTTNRGPSTDRHSSYYSNLEKQ